MDEKPKHPGGRPRIELDWDEIAKLAAMMCTQEEIASWFNCTIETLRLRCQEKFGISFLEYLRQKHETGRASLRRSQFLKATKGDNPTMMIWLGKQYLGQSDKVEQSVKSESKLIIDMGDDDNKDVVDDEIDSR